MTGHYAVMGNPIAHSQSPRIHAMFARQTGQDMQYTARLVPENGFEHAVRDFRVEGGHGLNVTVPFKTRAFAMTDTHSTRARRAGAVNTLVFSPAGIHGDNTDGFGLVRDLRHNHGLALEGKRILVLGAGGAVRGVLGPILDEAPSQVLVANRTAHKARTLAERFSGHGPVQGGGFADIGDASFDLIINGTAAGLHGEVPPIPEGCLREGGVCYDMVYACEPTAFVRWGQAHGASAGIDGLGMLVEQAAESFRLWRGVEPATSPVIKALRGR